MARIPRPSRQQKALIAVFVTAILAFPLGALAAHQFSDVPDSHPFHYDIDAVADANVTGGCGGGKYCPSSFVTRGQMAAFMNRLGALAPDKTPVVNAAEVDGINSVDLMPGGNPPTGMTIRGVFALNGTAGITWDSYSFGYELSMSPEPHYLPVGAAPTADCPGSATNPEAAMGQLCVYEDTDSVSGNPVFDCIFGPTSISCDTTNRQGFGLAQNGDDTGWFTGGTWAVTEPPPGIISLSEPEGDGRSPFEEVSE